MDQISEDQIKLIFDYLEENSFSKIKNLILSNKLQGETIQYSVILDTVKNLNGEVRDNLYNHAKEFDFSKMVLPNENESMTNFKKVIEYILLEIPRINDYERMNEQIRNSESLSRNIREQLREYKETIDKHEKKMSKMQGEFISILSIFSAVIIAFFGGLNLLSNVLTSINQVSKYRTIVVVIVIGLVLFNVIYILLYNISRLIDSRINTKKTQIQCANCRIKYYKMICIIKKYPVAFFYNLFSLIGIVSISILYLMDYYNIISYIMVSSTFIPDDRSWILITSIILVVLIFILGMLLKLLFGKIVGKRLKKVIGTCDYLDEETSKINCKQIIQDNMIGKFFPENNSKVKDINFKN